MEIILASGSPRRKHLMIDMDFSVQVKPLNIDEKLPPGLPARKAALYVAQKKGAAAKKKWGTEKCILAADSLVILENKALSKPLHPAEAMEMLRRLSGKVHEVHTAFHLQYKDQLIAQRVISKVTMDHISEKEAKYYVDRYEPYDKAGSYAIQEWVGHCKVKKIEGSYTNIVGLPTYQVYRAISRCRRWACPAAMRRVGPFRSSVPEKACGFSRDPLLRRGPPGTSRLRPPAAKKNATAKNSRSAFIPMK